jgi:hypothetical protein
VQDNFFSQNDIEKNYSFEFILINASFLKTTHHHVELHQQSIEMLFETIEFASLLEVDTTTHVNTLEEIDIVGH